ncbi:MAG: uracil-DNA glycosylase [Spirochaetia bacterium]|nr:uracil-DNA glycosylase [Spirochaetia bacterium]
MENFDSEYWKLINDFEDYIKFGQLSGRKIPEAVLRKVAVKKADTLDNIAAEVCGCRKCRLCQGRHKAVPGMGVMHPDVMVIGEGPGGDEDVQGLPFVGAAGKYLDKWLAAIQLDRNQNCFIGNVVKCRPPGNRDPQPDEITFCLPYLKRQIAILKPKMILTVGRISGGIISGQEPVMGRLRGHIFYFDGIPVIPTYHPSAVLRNPSLRQAVWDDLRFLRSELDRIKNGC